MSEPIIYELIDDNIGRIMLNRPEAYNALSIEMMQAFSKTLTTIDKARNIKTLIIQGAGKGFCAGHDLQELHQSENITKRREIFELCSSIMLQLQNLTIPVIAAVHGVATAAGCQLVATADLAFAEEGARFGTPGVNIGLFCSTPMVALSRAMHRKQAMRMLLEGELISCQTACDYGLINDITPKGKLDETVLNCAKIIASKSKVAVEYGKQSFYRQIDMDTALAYDYCGEIMALNLSQPEAEQGILAFLNKQKPKF